MKKKHFFKLNCNDIGQVIILRRIGFHDFFQFYVFFYFFALFFWMRKKGVLKKSSSFRWITLVEVRWEEELLFGALSGNESKALAHAHMSEHFA